MSGFDFWKWVAHDAVGEVKLGDTLPFVLHEFGPPDYWEMNNRNIPQILIYSNFRMHFKGNVYATAKCVFGVYEPQRERTYIKDFFGIKMRRAIETIRSCEDHDNVFCNERLVDIEKKANTKNIAYDIFIWKNEIILMQLNPHLRAIFSGKTISDARLYSVEWSLDKHRTFMRESKKNES